MEQILNTLFVQKQQSYLRLDHDTVRLELKGESLLRVPLHHLGGFALFGNVMISPFLVHECAGQGRSIVWFTEGGRFRARIAGPTSGNVLLRQAQYRAAQDEAITTEIARRIVAGKIRNARNVVMRAAREADSSHQASLGRAVKKSSDALQSLKTARDLNAIRGCEGQAGRAYFETFANMIRVPDAEFQVTGRSRRPPRDPVNALLSFAYALLRNDCASACEGVGLDPQMGYLHAVRPGRPALALDLMEEFRSILADRVVLSLINLKQLKAKDFRSRPGGAVELTESARKVFIEAYQRRKQERISHPVLNQKIPLGLVPHVQARLLARHLRGDIDAYVPFTPK